jgi:chemotaxis protein MotB
MRRHLNLVLSISCALLLSACVSQKKYQASLNREQDLTEKNNQLSQEITQLKGQVESLEGNNAQLNKQIDDARRNASAAMGSANITQKQLEAEQRRLWDLHKLLDQQRQAVEDLRKKMADALTGFNSNELQVFTKNGKVYVSMQESLLFPSGSAVVNPKGKEALGTLAQVLNTNPDINVIVEGHTDSIPI